MLGAGPGVAAVQQGQLVGFMCGLSIPLWRSKPTMFSPEWANGALLPDSRSIYEQMYAYLAPQWLTCGASTHLVSIMAHDDLGIDAWQWLGFAYVAVDGVRSLSPISHRSPEIQIHRACQEDIDGIMPLTRALEQHLAARPTYLVGVAPEERSELETWLADTRNALWLARRDRQVLSFLRIGPSSGDACAIIQDEATASITSAFTVPAARGIGVATALLNHALGWARGEGYARSAVDFEPMNTLAAHFWMQHFSPVCYALARDIDAGFASV
jgi:GNAT superfamily N-acetyltransferase